MFGKNKDYKGAIVDYTNILDIDFSTEISKMYPANFFIPNITKEPEEGEWFVYEYHSTQR